MRILWITNIMLPPLCKAMNLPEYVVGGWMYSSLKRLADLSDNEFAVATVYGGKDFVKKEIDGIVYYLLPLFGKSNLKYHKALEAYWREVESDFKPDVVHIHGSELPHGLAYVNASGNVVNVVVSVQGLVSSYYYYYYYGLTNADILRNLTPRDIVRGTIWQGKKDFKKRSKYEIDLFSKVCHVIGRTDWDKANTWAINPEAKYLFCNETLRDEFYKHKWNYAECEKHSLFVSQAGYPIKGLHQLLKALPMVIDQYPDTKLYVGGDNITAKSWYKLTGYGHYIKILIKRLGLDKHLVFTGNLNEKMMCERFLKSNVFVSPSSIENSPNSLGEAQMLGVPCIASYVGGVANMIPDSDCGKMYRFEEINMLAKAICDMFAESASFDNTKMRNEARKRHDADVNARRLLDIYGRIASFKTK